MSTSIGVYSVLWLLVGYLLVVNANLPGNHVQENEEDDKESTLKATDSKSDLDNRANAFESYDFETPFEIEIVEEESDEAITPIEQATSDAKYADLPSNQDNTNQPPQDEEEINSESADDHEVSEESEQPDRPLTEEELKAKMYYETAMNLLNSTNPDRGRAYNLLLESSKLNNSKAMSMAAQALIFGDNLPIDFNLAKRFLKQLATKGDPSAQMVKYTYCLNNFLHAYKFLSSLTVPWIHVCKWSWR